ncbi:hypothetical protein [Halopiger xanaduensis]|nr:hypothetical protein [Halopiger xanaduensis]
MSDGSFGLTEAVSMALGGMIGGGIYAVFGVGLLKYSHVVRGGS